MLESEEEKVEWKALVGVPEEVGPGELGEGDVHRPRERNGHHWGQGAPGETERSSRRTRIEVVPIVPLEGHPEKVYKYFES